MNNNHIHFKYLIGDIFAAILVWALFILFRKTINDISIINNIEFFVVKPKYYLTFFFFPFVSLFIHYITGFYVKADKNTRLTIFLSTVASSLLISLVVFMFFMLEDTRVSNNYYYVSLTSLFTIFFICTFIIRRYHFHQIIKNFKTKKWAINTIIIGNGATAKRIASDLAKNSIKHNLIGFVAVDTLDGSINKENLLGNAHQLEHIIKKNGVQEAIIALDNPDEQKLFAYINTLYKFDVDIQFTARLYEILTGSARIENIGMQPLVSLTDLHMSSWQIAVKRLIDIALSACMLFILIPLFIYFAIAIKLDSKGPVFYMQERIGRFGKPFKIIKFRTMKENSENGFPQLSSSTDERITRIGRTLRKYRIDELPQFLNILRGDMSLVGPRPERKYFINQIIEIAPYYCLIYKIRPGLTSWGPIKIGYSDSIDKMVERLNYDIIYIENMSLINDLHIMLLTLEIVFKGKGV